MLNESSVTGDATGAPFSFQSGISSSNARDSNTLPAVTVGGRDRRQTDDPFFASENTTTQAGKSNILCMLRSVVCDKLIVDCSYNSVAGTYSSVCVCNVYVIYLHIVCYHMSLSYACNLTRSKIATRMAEFPRLFT